MKKQEIEQKKSELAHVEALISLLQKRATGLRKELEGVSTPSTLSLNSDLIETVNKTRSKYFR